MSIADLMKMKLPSQEEIQTVFEMLKQHVETVATGMEVLKQNDQILYDGLSKILAEFRQSQQRQEEMLRELLALKRDQNGPGNSNRRDGGMLAAD